jgi:hypothetical protein
MFRVELSLQNEPTEEWLTRVFYSAIAHGIRFNSGHYDGTYRVIPEDLDEEVVVRESGSFDRTELIADAIETYTSFSIGSTEFGMMTTYTGCETDIPCSIQLIPRDSGHLLSFGTNTKEIRKNTDLRAFVELPKAIFERFEFTYGACRQGEQESIPTTAEEAKQDHPRTVTLYSSGLADEIGRERLLSAPAAEVSELRNGSVLILASAGYPASREQIEELRGFLG